MQKIIFTPLYMVLFLYENTIYCGHFSKSSILGQPPRTVLALFTHTAPHEHTSLSSKPCPLYVAVSFPPFLHDRAWMMFHHNAVTRVTSFPPAKLPAFTGTMTPSDFLCSTCLPPFIISCPAYSLQSKKTEDLPGYHIFILSDMPWSSTPGRR